MAVEYAGILAAVSLMAISLTGAYGRNVSAVFNSSSVGIAAVAKAAKAQKVSVAGAKTAYRRAPYKKPALKLVPKPVLRWSNPLRGEIHGSVYL